MTQILVYADADNVLRLVRSLQAKGMSVSPMRNRHDTVGDESKVELLVTVPEHRIGEAFQTISSSAS